MPSSAWKTTGLGLRRTLSRRARTSRDSLFTMTSSTYIYTLSLHDALPILSNLACALIDLPRRAHAISPLFRRRMNSDLRHVVQPGDALQAVADDVGDRKSTRLNSSHSQISYAVVGLENNRVGIASHTVKTSPNEQR